MAAKEEKEKEVKNVLLIQPIKNKKGYQYKKIMMRYEEGLEFVKKNSK